MTQAQDQPATAPGASRMVAQASQPHPRQLLIDLSEVVTTDYGTGIHRVVRNLTRALLQTAEVQDWSVIPVAHAPDGAIHSARDYVVERLAAPCPAHGMPPVLEAGDVLLLLDSAWEHPERFLPGINRIRAAGGHAGAYVYDLIPIRFPQYCVEFMPAVFERWLRFVVEQCDFLVCISRAVADDLKAWIDEHHPTVRRGLVIGHTYLGAEIDELAAQAPPSAEMEAAMRGGTSVLMVGTIEPRKRHDLALAAFEAAWAAGSDQRLVLAGRQGWNVAELAERIRLHPELGRRLFWIDTPSDHDLAHAYAHAARLLQASDAEGFGLPVVEAARYATPLLLSAIPVFREIAGDWADYFLAGDAISLQAWIAQDAPAPRPSSTHLAITWRQSAAQLLGLLGDGGWDHVVGDA